MRIGNTIGLRALAITLLLAVSLYYTYGQYAPGWVWTLPFIFILSVYNFPFLEKAQSALSLLSLCVIVFSTAVSALSLLPDYDPFETMIVDVATTDYFTAMRVLFGFAGVGSVLLFFFSKKKLAPLLFFGICGCLTAAYALVVPTAPFAQIDVWTLHEQAADAFAHFQNPYLVNYFNIYPEHLWPVLTPFGVNFAYLPGVFIWMAPFKALGLDTRFSQVFAVAMTALLLYLISARIQKRQTFMTFAPALVFLSFPINTFFLVRAWNDNLVVFFFALAAFFLVAKKPKLFFLACGCLLLMKQYVILFFPLLLWASVRHLGQKPISAILKMIALPTLVCGAYLIADWRNFLGSLYGLHFLKHPNVNQVFPDRLDSYSLMNELLLRTGIKLSWFFLVVMAMIAWRLYRRNRQSLSVPNLFEGLAALSFAMVIFAPIAFANYYEFAFGLLMIAFAMARTEKIETTLKNPAPT